MRAVVQRVSRARVDVSGTVVGEIGKGLLVFLGVGRGDSEKEAGFLANKVAHLRIFSDDQGLMNRSVMDVEGEVLVVSQFTLWGDCQKGRRPSFVRAAPPEEARALYEEFIRHLRGKDLAVSAGEFREMMEVHLVNEGPVTVLIDTEKTF